MEISAIHSLAQTRLLKTSPPPLEFNQAIPNTYQLIALYLSNKMTPTLTEAPHKKNLLAQRGQQVCNVLDLTSDFRQPGFQISRLMYVCMYVCMYEGALSSGGNGFYLNDPCQRLKRLWKRSFLHNPSIGKLDWFINNVTCDQSFFFLYGKRESPLAS